MTPDSPGGLVVTLANCGEPSYVRLRLLRSSVAGNLTGGRDCDGRRRLRTRDVGVGNRQGIAYAGRSRVRLTKVARPFTTGSVTRPPRSAPPGLVPIATVTVPPLTGFPEAVLDLDAEPETTIDNHASGGLGLDRHLTGHFISGEGGNEHIGDRRAQPGREIVARLGGISVVAAHDVVKVG